MRLAGLAIFVGLTILLPGCATVGESVFDCIWDAVSDSDRVDDDEARMLQRKGITPGSKDHQRLKWEEEQWREFRED